MQFKPVQLDFFLPVFKLLLRCLLLCLALAAEHYVQQGMPDIMRKQFQMQQLWYVEARMYACSRLPALLIAFLLLQLRQHVEAIQPYMLLCSLAQVTT